MEARAIAVIVRSVRSLWLGSLATLKPQTTWAPWPRNTSAVQEALKLVGNRTTTADREAAGPRRYSFEYTNGTQTIEDTRSLEFSTDHAARREALRTARAMAHNVSWKSSARGTGWTVLVINPMGQQICEVPVRFSRRWF
jgi:hypothetical protein